VSLARRNNKTNVDRVEREREREREIERERKSTAFPQLFPRSWEHTRRETRATGRSDFAPCAWEAANLLHINVTCFWRASGRTRERENHANASSRTRLEPESSLVDGRHVKSWPELSRKVTPMPKRRVKRDETFQRAEVNHSIMVLICRLSRDDTRDAPSHRNVT